VTKVAFLGMYTQIGGELAGGALVTVHQTSEASMGEALAVALGQRIWVGWKSQDGQILPD
jgi:hypothetical protein